jgi:hypothetical protein
MNIKTWVAAALMIPSIASAQFMDGNKLMNYLGSDSHIERIHGMGYVIGVHDVYDDTICLARGVTTQQASDIVLKFLRENPSKRNLAADILVLVALGKDFPCPKGEKL